MLHRSAPAQFHIDDKNKTLTVNGKSYGVNDTLSIDGSSGEVIEGTMPTVAPEVSGPLAIVMKWADKYRTLKIRTNADTPADAARARGFGAQGIGLCRTEHMFSRCRCTEIRQICAR